MAGRGGLSTSTMPPVAARRTPGGPQRCTGAGRSAGRVLQRKATSAHTGVETGLRYPREGDGRVRLWLLRAKANMNRTSVGFGGSLSVSEQRACAGWSQAEG